MNIWVASDNPVKINAVKQAVTERYPDAQVQGRPVPSGVAEQPMSDWETLTGSINRAKNLKALLSQEDAALMAQVDLFIGAEGGVYQAAFADNDHQLWSTVWVSVLDQQDQVYSASGGRFRLPQQLAEGILAGRELGTVVGELTGDMEQKRKAGAIGILTAGFINRTEEYVSITKLAIGLWHGRRESRKFS